MCATEPREVPQATELGSWGLPAPLQALPHADAGVLALTLAAKLAPGGVVVSRKPLPQARHCSKCCTWVVGPLHNPEEARRPHCMDLET